MLSAVGDRYVGRNLITNRLSAVGDRYFGRNLITNRLSAVGDRYFGRNLIKNRLSAVGDRYFETNKVAHGAKSWVNAVGGGPIHYPYHGRQPKTAQLDDRWATDSPTYMELSETIINIRLF